MRRRSRALGAVLVPLVALLLGAVGSGAASSRLRVRVFTRIPAPGYPANAILSLDGSTVYAGTFHSFSSPSDTGPSKVFAYDRDGKRKRTYTIKGQTPGAAHGVQVAVTDRSGILYLLDQAPARIIKLNPKTGSQTTWATFASVPACTGKPNGQCTLGTGGNAPEPDFAAWGPDGSLYVTDYNQSLIWRVPPGGGKATVWDTDSRFFGVNIVGPAGIELMPDHKTLLVDTGGDVSGEPGAGKLYTLPIEAGGRPGPLQQLWQSGPGEAPDGFAIARSGDVYIALVGPSGNAVVELSPTYKQIARVPASAVANQQQQIPFDAPGSVTFLGDQVLVANQSAIQNDSKDWALLEIGVAERGLPIFLPPRRSTKTRYRLSVHPRRATSSTRTVFRFLARRHGRALAHALIRFAGHGARTNKHGVATITTKLRSRGRHIARLIVNGRTVATATVRVRSTRRNT